MCPAARLTLRESSLGDQARTSSDAVRPVTRKSCMNRRSPILSRPTDQDEPVTEDQKIVLNVPGGLSPGYPKVFEREVTLKDGTRLRIRPILPEDEPRQVTLYGRLSRRTKYQRFFTVMKRLPPEWTHYFANVDYRQRMALVVERDLGWRPELIGVARYEPSDEKDTAEAAIVVQDYWQGRGLGTILLKEILRAGERNGIRRFRAYALADNHRMLAVLSRWTDIQERKTYEGVMEVLFTRR